MKKLYTLITAIIFLCGMHAHTQPLQNTTWEAYNVVHSLIGYFRFGTNLFSGSLDGVNYQEVSKFYENGNQFRIVDLPASGCGVTDTGKYTTRISHDTLSFTLISDVCQDRINSLINVLLLRHTSGTERWAPLQSLQLFPNPSNGIFSITPDGGIPVEVNIYNLTGEMIYNAIIQPGKTEIDLSNKPKGIYILRTESDNTIMTKKIIFN